MLSEIGQQSSEPLADLKAEREYYCAQAARAASWLDEQPQKLRLSIRVLTVRCERGGCVLAEVFRFPLENGGERFLASPRTRRGDHRSHGFLNWAFSDDWRGMPMYLPSGCRHGAFRLGTGWLLDCVALLRGWHHASETVESVRSHYPLPMQKALRSAVFHPGMQAAWRENWRQVVVDLAANNIDARAANGVCTPRRIVGIRRSHPEMGTGTNPWKGWFRGAYDHRCPHIGFGDHRNVRLPQVPRLLEVCCAHRRQAWPSCSGSYRRNRVPCQSGTGYRSATII